MTMPTRTTVTMRFDCPSSINYRLHNLASKLRVPVRELLHDGVALVLRYHGDAKGVPQPPVRVPPQMTENVMVEDVEIEEEIPTP